MTEVFCRTAPATPGLLNTFWIKLLLNSKINQDLVHCDDKNIDKKNVLLN